MKTFSSCSCMLCFLSCNGRMVSCMYAWPWVIATATLHHHALEGVGSQRWAGLMQSCRWHPDVGGAAVLQVFRWHALIISAGGSRRPDLPGTRRVPIKQRSGESGSRPIGSSLASQPASLSNQTPTVLVPVPFRPLLWPRCGCDFTVVSVCIFLGS